MAELSDTPLQHVCSNETTTFLQISVVTDAISKELKASQNTSQVKTLAPTRLPQFRLTYRSEKCQTSDKTNPMIKQVQLAFAELSSSGAKLHHIFLHP